MAAFSPLDEMDKRMVVLFREGDQEDYRKLYRKYAPAVLGVLTRSLGNQQLAEECVNIAFRRIWQQRLSYDPGKERLFTWMLKIARASTTAIPVYQKPGIEDEIREEIDLVYATDIRDFMQSRRSVHGDGFIDGQAEIIRRAIHLIYFESYSFAGAAKELGISIDTLRGEMIKSIKQLKGSLLS